MKIIPAIDIIDGKCVRLTQGDYAQKKIYNEDPVAVAKMFEDAGIQYLHVVDLDGAKQGKITNYKVLEAITSNTKLNVDFGGGLKTDEDITIAFNSGAAQVTAGSIAVKNPDVVYSWLEKYGADKIILGADCRNRFVATNGWQEQSSLNVLDFIKAYQIKGVTSVICTDISKDGMLLGPSFELYAEILEQTKIGLIASGGISSIDDVIRLKALCCGGAIIGKAIYEGNISLTQLTQLC